MNFEKKQILITVKAYPNPSTKYGETVCCAGVDINSSQWIRLYPIPFRDLDIDKKFKKYSIIEVDCAKTSEDKRPESYRVNSDTIKVIDWLDTEKGKWNKRKSIVLKLPIFSMCQMFKDAKEKDLSLGLIKPDEISFEFSKHSLSNQHSRKDCYAQLSFLNKMKDAIEEIPFNFYYRFKCAGEDTCPGHKLLIIDWEIGQAYRDWQSNYSKNDILVEKIRQKWMDIANTSKKNVYFYVGNMKRFRKNFMILGVFYPSNLAV